MTLWPRSLLIPTGLVALFLGLSMTGTGDAWAQIGPNQLPQPGTPGPTTSKPDGVAEQAKEGPDRLPTTPVLPPSKSQRKRFELFELNGYFRLRYDWFKKLHLGFADRAEGGAPFSLPFSCYLDVGNIPTGADNPCADSIKTANLRLRLEPTINVSETARIHMQVDVLDNLVLGSTPESGRAGQVTLGAFSGSQAPPELEGNRLGDAVRVRRVWGEIDTSLGHVSFGRQPWHWGMGIYANAGGADPFSGTYDLDSDFGDSVDRVMFRAGIPGTDLQAAIATDWTSTRPSAAQTDAFLSRYNGQPWDLDDIDDVSQWVFMITRFDKPKQFDDARLKNGWALNYGAMLAYRTQEWDTSPPAEGQEFSDSLVYRGLKSYTPNIWLRFAREQLTFELEALATIGGIDNVSDIELPKYPADDSDPNALDEPVEEPVDIRRFGGVARLTYKLLSGKGTLGFEVGHASGDQWDNVPPGSTHVSHARPLPISTNDTVIENYLFHPDYHVDLILFRQLLGTVTNATYFKPRFQYAITEAIAARAAAILSLANRPVATPGNGGAYGLEFDADVSYVDGPFTVGLAYGVLFPMSAMNHGAGLGFGDDNLGANGTGDAETAQTIQARLILRF